MIKACIFDMDGVLFDTERLMMEGWLEAGRQMNFTLTDQQLDQMRGSTRAHSCALFEKWFDGRIDYNSVRTICFQYLADCIEKNSVPLKKGLKELLGYLKKHHIPAAVATSTLRKTAAHYWELAGITDFFSATVCGDEVINGKPDPEIFLTAAKKLDIPISKCLIVEDSINGLKAARASGAFSCMIPDLTPYTEDLRPLCDYVYHSLDEIISLF